MAEHYPRNTVWFSAWCAKCRKDTPHSAAGCRKGSCLTCLAKLDDAHAAAPKKSVRSQGDLFPPAA